MHCSSDEQDDIFIKQRSNLYVGPIIPIGSSDEQDEQ